MSEEPSYTPREEFQCDNSQIHYQGCKCHEARWRRTMDVVVAERDAARAEAAGYRAALEDIANFGCRHDLNPTGYFNDCGHFEVWRGAGGWHAYVKSMDESVRERARQALATQEQERKG
jgi:hypothetical protein